MSTDSVPDMIDMALCVIKCLVLCCATLATWADQKDSLVQGFRKRILHFRIANRMRRNLIKVLVQILLFIYLLFIIIPTLL